MRNEVISEAIGTKQERRERKRKINVVELFHPKKRLKLDPDASSKSSSELERRKKAEKGKRCKESDSAVSDGHGNEGEKKYINVDTNGTVHEAVEGSKIDETVEERQVDEDSLARPKKKIVPRSGGGRLCMVWLVFVDSVEYMKGALDIILLCTNLRCR